MQSFDAFKVGDTVYVYKIEHVRVPVPCPDCKDTRTWTVTTKAGDTWDVTCPRCNGAKYDFQQPHRLATKLEVLPAVVSEVTIRQRKHYNADEIGTWIDYNLKQDKTSIHRRNDGVFATEEDARAAGEAEMVRDLTKDKQRWQEKRERVAKYASATVLDAVMGKGFQAKRDIEDKLEKLKEGFLEAIKSPDFDGPKLRKGVFGNPEITSEAMAEWLNGIFSEAELDGWSEEEIHEATCHC